MTKQELERIANQVMEDSEFRKANTDLRHWRVSMRELLVEAMRIAVAPLELERDTLAQRLEWYAQFGGLPTPPWEQEN